MYGSAMMQHVAQVAISATTTETIPSKNIIKQYKTAEPRWPLQRDRHANPIPSTARTRFKYIVGTTNTLTKKENAKHAMM